MKALRHIGFILALMVSWCASVWAQTEPKILPEVTSTEGREFFVTWLPNGGSEASSTDLKLTLLASSRNANTIVVELPGGGSQTYTIAAGQTQKIEIDPNTAYWNPSANEEETPLDKGIRVYSDTDEKFTLYSVNQMGTLGTYSYDGAHILPVEALGTEYMVLTNDADAIATEFVIMSTRPGVTNVTMSLKTNSRRGNTQDLSVTLSGSKKVYIVRSKAPDPSDPMDQIDLSGSTICADQPIAVWSGNQYTLVPNQGAMSNNHAYDQLLPLNRWGKSFIVPMTAHKARMNAMRIVAQLDGTNVSIKYGTSSTDKTLNAGEATTLFLSQAEDNPNPQNVSRYITSDKPIQVYLLASSGGANTWYDDDGNPILPYNPSMTLIPPLEYLTDSTIFRTYTGGEGTLKHGLNLWALSSETANIRLDGNPITGWKTLPTNSAYSQVTCEIEDTTHIITAPTKSFSGYAYGVEVGEAYLYPVGYDFQPNKDSLFLLGDEGQYPVPTSEWKENAISDTESGWLLERLLQDDDTYLLDSILVCDSTTLQFPIKTYNTWSKVRWEIEGTIQGTGYFTPEEQLAENVARPELQHQFTLLPIEENDAPFEDFEVRGILFHAPILCEIPEDKWEKDTFATVVRVLREYNDTTWRAICMGDTVQFFKDTVWNVNPTTITGKPVPGVDYTLQISIFNDTLHNPDLGYHQYPLGDTTITRHYISTGGCDSTSTLKLFVCQRYFEHKDTTVCQEDTRKLDYGEFFKRYKTGNKWPIAEDTLLYDTLRAKGCMNSPEFDEFKAHCKSFNGCDSVLELRLTVKKLIKNTYRENLCISNGTYFEWREKESDRLIATFDTTNMTKDSTYIFRDTVRYVNCTDCPQPNGCDSVRNTLYLQYISDDGQFHTVHVCQGKKYTYTNMSSSLTFNSNGKLCNTPYLEELNVKVMGIVDGQVTELCSFIDKVTFYVDTVYKDQMTYDTVCIDPVLVAQNKQYYEWANHPKFDSIPVQKPGLFTYVDTMKTVGCNCDSICVLKLRVGSPQTTSTAKVICDDEAFTWQDTLFYGVNYKGTIPAKSKKITDHIYTSERHLSTRYGCDSLLTFRLTIWPTYVAEQKDTAICANETYNFYGTVYNTATNPWKADTTYILEINDQSIHGCDSIVQHNVTVYPIYPDVWEISDTVCQEQGAYYTWANHPQWTVQQSIAVPGSYELVDHQYSIHGCDSIIHRTLVVMPRYDLSFSHTMSSEDTYIWDNRIYAGLNAEFDNPQGLEVVYANDGRNKYVDSLTTTMIGTHECDSVRTLTLRIGKVFRDTTYDATCANCGTYEWTITSPITGIDTTIYITDLPAPYEQRFYYDSLLTVMDFDSIYVRVLTTYPDYYYTDRDSDEICQGEPYDWNGHMSGDNGVQHRLSVDGQPISVIPTDQHGTIFVTDSMLTDTIFTDPSTGVVKPMHCDSVHVLTLTIHPTYNDRYVELTDYAPLSSNDTMSHFTQPQTLFVGYDFDYAAAGTTPSDLEQQYQHVVYLQPTGNDTWRDSVVNTSQFGCDSVHYLNIHICEISFTQVIDSIADNDSTWYFGGDTSQGAHTLPLVTGHKFHRYDNGTKVDYSQATGRTMREYLFIDTLRTVHGCDSIVHDSVRVFPAYSFEEKASICSNARFDWRKYIYLNHNKSGYVYDSVNYEVGTHTFDSVYVLDLDVVPSGYWQYDTVLCMNDTITWHHQKIFYQPGGLQYIEAHYKDSNSMCGDIYHLDLTFMPYYSTALVEYDTICQDSPYHWITEGETKEHLENLRNGTGQRLSFIPTDVAGDFIYYDSLKTVSCGCDSVYTLQLHINPTFHTYDTTFVLCSSDTLRWQEREYTYQGELEVQDTVRRQTIYGCDSIHYMKLHWDLSYDYTETVFLCSDVEHYQWEDIVFDDTLRDANSWLEPRSYQFMRTYPTVLGGCDSTLRLDITIAPNFDSIWTDTICRGETYNLFGQLLTEPGQYMSQQPNQFGCSTFYYLTLEQIPLSTYELQVDPVCVDEEGRANTYQLHYTYTGEFAPISFSLRYDSVAQALGFEDLTDIPIAANQLTLDLPVPEFSQSTDYPRPGVYQAQIAFNNGVCLSDSLLTYDFSMAMNYPSWLTEQRFGDVIALLNESLNGGYTWTEYQWYQGDSMLVGQTKPYLYIPEGLVVGEQYHVLLTRDGETESYPTCPITVVMNPNGNTHTPTMGYLAVTPTCIVTANPTTNILSRKSGTYSITNANGRLVSQGAFTPDVTPIRLPAVDGLYIIQLWSPDTPEEPYRAIKVLVREQCENCATSF